MVSRLALGIAAVGLGTSVGPLDTAVNIAFPAITTAFGIELRSIQWVVIAYVLTYSSLMLICGKVGDLFGHRRVFRAGCVVSLVAYLLCSVPVAFGWFLAARVFQGIGTALVLSCAAALITALYPERQRTRALGVYGMMMALGAAIGPSLGGLLVDLWGWNAVFWFRAPIALAGLLLSPWLPAPQRVEAARAFDFAGGILLAGLMSMLLLSIASLRMPGAGAWLPATLGVVALGLLVAFVRQERRAPDPILRPSLFADVTFTIHNLASVAVNLASFSVLLLVPYYLVRSAGYGERWGGVVLALSAIGTMAGAMLAGRLSARIGRRPLAALGVLLCAAGLWGIGGRFAVVSDVVLAACLVCQGLGAGLFQVAYTDIVTDTLPPHERGVAGSLALVTRTVGVVSGATLLSALFSSLESQALVIGTAPPQAFLAAFQTSMQVAGIGLLVVVALTLVRPSAWFARGA
jgi:EmrB/QacA subfamily drug resistance transporter